MAREKIFNSSASYLNSEQSNVDPPSPPKEDLGFKDCRHNYLKQKLNRSVDWVGSGNFGFTWFKNIEREPWSN